MFLCSYVCITGLSVGWMCSEHLYVCGFVESRIILEGMSDIDTDTK